MSTLACEGERMNDGDQLNLLVFVTASRFPLMLSIQNSCPRL